MVISQMNSSLLTSCCEGLCDVKTGKSEQLSFGGMTFNCRLVAKMGQNIKIRLTVLKPSNTNKTSNSKTKNWQ